jgi:hypothetical protein
VLAAPILRFGARGDLTGCPDAGNHFDGTRRVADWRGHPGTLDPLQGIIYRHRRRSCGEIALGRGQGGHRWGHREAVLGVAPVRPCDRNGHGSAPKASICSGAASRTDRLCGSTEADWPESKCTVRPWVSRRKLTPWFGRSRESGSARSSTTHVTFMHCLGSTQCCPGKKPGAGDYGTREHGPQAVAAPRYASLNSCGAQTERGLTLPRRYGTLDT